ARGRNRGQFPVAARKIDGAAHRFAVEDLGIAEERVLDVAGDADVADGKADGGAAPPLLALAPVGGRDEAGVGIDPALVDDALDIAPEVEGAPVGAEDGDEQVE